MKNKIVFSLLTFLFIGFIANAQKREKDDSVYAATVVKKIGSFKVSLDLSKKEALDIAEPILFKIYGEAKINEEKPYHAVKSGNYWVFFGSMDCTHCKGGVFEIVINARNGKVEYCMHGK
jgi:NTF2 fold immunity protein of polymorphic toxin system component